jgi:hypothetical protein
MNSNFVITLKHIRYEKSDFPDAPLRLREANRELFDLINENQIQHNQELKKYCKAAYHQIKSEQERIRGHYDRLCHTIDYTWPVKKIEKIGEELDYFSEILDWIDDTVGLLNQYAEVYWKPQEPGQTGQQPKPKGTRKKEPLLTLEEVFSDTKQLEKLVSLLVEKGFVTMESGSPKWTGIDYARATGAAKQLIALSDVCKQLYKSKQYQKRQLHHAWTNYFNYKVSVEMFAESKKPPEESTYHDLFRNLMNSITTK